MNTSSADMNTISETDARAMVRLLGQTVAVEGGHSEKKRFLMKGLADLLNLDAWVWTLGCQNEVGGKHTYVGFQHDGLDEQRFASLLQVLEHPEMASIAGPFYAEVGETQLHTTRRRQDMDPSGRAETGEVGDLWRAANIGPIMLSIFPLDPTSISAIALYRAHRAAPFTEREKQIAHIILEEVSWLHMSGWPEDRGATVPHLSPRQRTVLNLILDGQARKQIAANLEIAENTVAGYAKEVYRHFSVNSQAELMHKFLSGREAAS